MKGRITYSYHDRWMPTGNTEGSLEVAYWLNDDVFRKNTIDWFVKQLNEFDFSSKQTNYIGSGNAHHVFSTGEHVFLMCEYVDDQKVLLTKEQCLYALEQYRAFLSRNFRKKTFTPVPFDIEYIAEGDEAIIKFNELGGILKA